MEYRYVDEAVKKIYFEVVVTDPDVTGKEFRGWNVTTKNREIRNWLGANCDCTWETQVVNMQTVGIYFDLDAEKDAATFKMFWHGIER